MTPQSSQIHPGGITKSTQSHPKFAPKSSQIHPKVIPNSPQCHPRIIPKSSNIISESSLWLPLGSPWAPFGLPLGSLWSSWDASGASSGFDAVLGVTFRANVAQVPRLRTKTSLPELSPGFSGSGQSGTWGAAPDPPSLAPGARMT